MALMMAAMTGAVFLLTAIQLIQGDTVAPSRSRQGHRNRSSLIFLDGQAGQRAQRVGAEERPQPPGKTTTSGQQLLWRGSANWGEGPIRHDSGRRGWKRGGRRPTLGPVRTVESWVTDERKPSLRLGPDCTVEPSPAPWTAGVGWPGGTGWNSDRGIVPRPRIAT
jgi:hypothetical protein